MIDEINVHVLMLNKVIIMYPLTLTKFIEILMFIYFYIRMYIAF